MASRQGGRRRRRGAATTAAAAIGLCLATVTTTHTSLAFHLHTGTRGIVASSSSSSSAVGGCDDAKTTAGGRRKSATAAAACRGPSSPPPPPADDRPEHHDADSSGSNGKGGGGAAKELSAALLSAMLLGNPQVSGAATATAQGPSTADQSRLMADLERRLTSVSSGPTAATTDPPGNAAAAAPASPAGRAEAPTAATVDSAPRVQSMFVPPSSMTPQAGAPSEEAAAAATAAGQRRQAGSSTPVPKPAIKMKEYKFTVKLPEFDVPTVGPITVPEEGNVFAGMEPRAIFKAPSRERVVAQPEFPGAGAVRGALESVGKGDGVKELTDAFAAAVPRQGDYNRAVMEFEERVSQLVKTTDNPTFAPGVPLAPEFASMLSKAKETAFNGIRPYLPKGAEPELALFMLVTLPVLTVALRSADENSRRPKPDPLPPASRPPRITRFPNSPAKVDAAAVAEARKEREAQADVDAVATLREELAVRGLAAVPVAEGASPAAAAAAAEVLHGGVAAAVAAKPDAITAELARLREELAAAGKLAAKVEALERANARLMGQVADLSKTPSIEEVRLRAEKEATRAAARREREEAQEAAYAGVQEKATKLSAAREKLSDAFPARESLAAVAASSAKKSPAASAKKPAAAKKPAPAKKAAAKKPAAKKPAAKKPAAAASTKKKKPVETKKKKAEAAPAKKAKAPGRKKAAAAAAADDPPAVESPEPTMLHNGASVLKEGTEAVVAAAAAAAGEAVTPNEYEDMSEDLSRAVLGVQGYDMDGLDLEMADLRPEDLEELLALEMGGLDMASRDEEDFGPEDDESMSQGLRMAAESALAHTSGGGAGRRIRTASPVGATSFRSAGGGGGGGGSAAVVAESRGGAPQATAVRDGEGVGFSSVPSATTEDDELAAFRRLEAEAVADFGTGAAGWGDQAAGGAAAAVGGGAGGVPQDDGDWGALSAKAVGRKTVAALKEFLDEEGMDYPSKIRKAELVDMVLNMLAEG